MEKQLHRLFVLSNVFVFVASLVSTTESQSNVSGVGDPGMQRDSLRVAFEAWNFCNEVGQQAPHMGSPRAAQCFDLSEGKPNHITKHITQSLSFFTYQRSFQSGFELRFPEEITLHYIPVS